jgi:hypothetical protein
MFNAQEIRFIKRILNDTFIDNLDEHSRDPYTGEHGNEIALDILAKLEMMKKILAFEASD